jgi:glycosyltransferase involved in cell wall biosynthesis
MSNSFPEIAVIIPCHNEAIAIGRVIDAFRAALPGATIFAYDNCSTDDTSRVAKEHGAVVRFESQKGKGNVVRRMFADVEADIYVMVDGDDTYDASAAPEMVKILMSESVDMVTAIREEISQKAYRRGHRFGNWLLTGLVAYIFGNRSQDMLSGYRVMSRRFIKSFPALSAGFEIETELTVHALQLRCPITERRTPYKERPVGSVSKLSSYRDGYRILRYIGLLVKEELPMAFFGLLSGLMMLAAVALAIPLWLTYLHTHLVPRLPTAVLVVGLIVSGALSLVCGLILSTVTRSRNEMKRLHYLAQSIRLVRR